MDFHSDTARLRIEVTALYLGCRDAHACQGGDRQRVGLLHSSAQAIPDFTPVVGFADDLGALMMAAAVIAAHIEPKHRQQARQKLREYFGDQADTDDEGSQPASSAS